jgi:class 3 adenylate cyclase/CHASE2 domain-containing sensor protein
MTFKLPIRLRRLRILGVALILSAVAAGIGVILYTLPKATLPPVNRIADYVLLNDAYFWAQEQQWLPKALRFPNRDGDNEKLRFVAIDEGSTAEPPTGLGQFPWPRSVHGNLLKRLAKAGAKIVTFDVLFLENDRTKGGDAVFAAGMRKQPTVLGFPMTTTAGGVLGETDPVPVLRSAARDIGFTTVDNPGGWLVGQFFTLTGTDAKGTHIHRSLAAATVEDYLGKKISVVNNWSAKIGDEEIPLDGDGQFTMLPFIAVEHVDQASTNGLATRAGAADISISFTQSVSYADLLRFDDDTMKQFANGAIVVIGPTAQGLGDFIVTPNGRYPGVFANLRLMDQLLDQKFIRRVPPWVDIALIILLPLLIGFVVTQMPATGGVLLAVAISAVYAAFAVSLYGFTLHWINLIHVSGAIILAALFVALYRTITEGADKRVIKEMFGKHVSPAIVDSMLNHDDPLKALDLSGKTARVTIFYSDIRGFTAMSEKMTPAQVYTNLNTYFEEMCTIVFEHGGYVDKFIGDCLMAVFSAPDPRPGTVDAYEATEAALRQQEKIDEMMKVWSADGRQTFNVGMGLNTGEVMMGNLGSSERLNYTVIGDNVNTAARLYNVAKGGQIIISESTYEEVKDRFIVNELPPVSVKGKTLPLRNFEIIGRLKPGEPNTSTLLDPENMPEIAIAADH